MKTCTRCLESKPESAFRGYRDASRGLRARCRACLREDYRKAVRPDWTQEQWETYCEKRRSKRTPEAEQRHWRNGHLQKHYGITVEDQDRMVAEQDGCCAICRNPLRVGLDANIDHDHETGAARGVLCNSCNLGLGNFKDDPARLQAAIEYLEAQADAALAAMDNRDLRETNRIDALLYTDPAYLDSLAEGLRKRIAFETTQQGIR